MRFAVAVTVDCRNYRLLLPNLISSYQIQQLFFRHHAQEIRRHAAAELKSGDGASNAATQRLIASQLGRSSVQFQAPPAASSHAPSVPAPTASPAVSHHSMVSMATIGGGPDAGGAVAVEPLDYEEYVSQRQIGGFERDPLAHVMDFPGDDIEVKIAPKKIRTMGHVMPEEPM